jgi:heptosyltransferase-2
MSTPALLRLREHFPNAHVALLVPEKLSGLWLHHPALNEVIAFDAGDNVFSVGRKLRGGQFDLALVFPNSPRSAMEVWFAKIPQRVGYQRAWRNWFLTHLVATRPGHVRMRKRSEAEIKELVEANPEQMSSGRVTPVENTAHHIREYLHLVSTLGAGSTPTAPRLEITTEEIQAAVEKFGLAKTVSEGRTILGINPGAEYGPAKRWPAERFIATVRDIQRQAKSTCLIFGGKADVAVATEIESGSRAEQSQIFNLAGKTSLRELMALLKMCRVFLSNDTGPMHLAAALGTPVVVPFGSTSPELTAPGMPGDPRHHFIQSNVPCAPCFLRECPIDLRCMRSITVDQIVKSISESLKT